MTSKEIEDALRNSVKSGDNQNNEPEVSEKQYIGKRR